MNPLSYTELDAWNCLLNKKVTAQQIGIIRLLDGALLQHYQQQQADNK